MARTSIPKFGSQRVFLAHLEQDSIDERELDFRSEFTLVRNKQKIEVLIPSKSQPDHQRGSQSHQSSSGQTWCKLIIKNHRKRAEFRRELSQLSDDHHVVGTQGSLVLFRLTDRESLSVELTIIRLAREVDLEYKQLKLVMPPSCFADGEDTETQRNAHLKSLCHTLPERPGFYVFASDVFGGLEYGSLQDIVIFSNPKNNNFHLIKCKIAEDHSHLNALSTKIGHNMAVTMLIKVHQTSQVIAFNSEDNLSRTPGQLVCLKPPKSLLLDSWRIYRGIELDLENKRLTEREHFIKYNNLNSSETQWKARVQTRSEVLKSWFPKKGKYPQFKLEPPQMVVLMKKGARSEEAKKISPKAELIEVRNYQPNEGLATFIFKARKHTSKPEISGEIHAIEDHGDSTQRQRRANANQRLMSRDIANPHMIEWLMSPEMARPPANQTLRYPFNRNLNEDQQRAVECSLNSEDVFLIQGPPGTGKTSVIVEIIKQLVQRGRLKDSEVTGPVRILVSSMQNDAIRHATDKIAGGDNDYDIQVFQQLSDYEQQIKDMYTDASQISSLIAQRCLQSDEVWEYETYRFAQKSALRLTNVLAEHIEAIKLGELPLSQATLTVEILESRMIEQFSYSEANMYRLLKSKAHTQTSQDYFEKELSKLISHLALTLSVAIEKLSKIDADTKETRTHTKHRENAEDNHTQAMLVFLHEQPQREALEQYKADILQLTESGGLQENLSILIKVTLKSLLKAFDRDRGDKIKKDWLTLKELLTQAQGELSFDESAYKRSPDELRNDEITRLYNGVNILIQQHYESFELRCVELAENSHLFALRQFAEELKMFPNQWVKLLERYAPVSAATCQRTAKFAKTNLNYDYVIIDEAGRVTPYDLLIPAIQGRHLILIGDQRQLPPTVEDSIERKMLHQSGDADVIKISDRSLFEELFDRLNASNKVMLRTQYRMNAKIGALVSEVFYNRRLSSYFKPNAPEKTPQMGLFNDEPLVWIDVATQCKSASFKYENPHETEAIFNIILSLREQLTASDTGEKRVGIVTAYGDQKRAIQRRLKELRLDSYFDIGTIDSFQGKEFELVILSTSTHSTKGDIGFMKLPNRINVALSRAQRQLLILGSSTTHRKAGYWLNDCLDYIHREGLVINSLDLSQYLP